MASCQISQGRLLIDATGDRAVERVEKDGSRTVLADRYEGKRISCPNDIAAKSDGAVYFYDSGGGCLQGGENGPQREIAFHGVYLIKDGKSRCWTMIPWRAAERRRSFTQSKSTLHYECTGQERDFCLRHST